MNIVFNLIVLIGILIFITSWLLNREQIAGYYISEFVNLKYGLLTTAAFITTGTGIILRATIFNNQLLRVYLIIYGSLFLLLGVLPVDRRGELHWYGIIHTIIAHACFDSFAIVPTILSLKGVISLQPLHWLIIIISLISGVLIPILSDSVKGVLQRIAIFIQILLIVIFPIDL